MAIKWKSNKRENDNQENKELKLEKKLEKKIEQEKKPKQWLGFLLAGLFVLLLAVSSGEACDYIRVFNISAQEQWEKEHKKTEKNLDLELDYLSDDEKMSLVSNIYYLDYKLNHMYEGISVSDYLLAENTRYHKASATEKQKYAIKAAQYMDVLYSVYHRDYEVQNMQTCTYMERDGVSVGVLELSKVEDKKAREELDKKYNSYLVIDYDAQGKPTATAYNLDAGKFVNYLSGIKLQAVAENYSNRDLPMYSIAEDEYGTETYEDMGYEEETYEESEFEEDMGDAVTDTASLAEEEETDIPRTNADTVAEQGKGEDSDKITIDFPKIQNTKVIIGFVPLLEEDSYSYYDKAYTMGFLLFLFFAVMVFIGALILQNVPVLGMRNHPLFQLSTELLTFFNLSVVYMVGDLELPYVMVEFEEAAMEFFGDAGVAYFVSLGIWIVIFSGLYWLIANCLPYIMHPVKQIREHSILIKIVGRLKEKCEKAVAYVVCLKPEKGLQKNVLKITVVNFILISIFCVGWVAGIVLAAVYSVLLYVLFIKKGSRLQKQYETLLKMVKNMAEGNLNAEEEISEDLGVFEPVKCELFKVRQGFRHAVEEEVRSQNMKTELITNVSHDLKTPLTAIITYVDLLKDENISEETRKEYIATLDKKSQRLKVLIEDLFEVSKASTNNITLHYADMDLCNLIKQVRLENEERIMNSDLVFRWNLPEEKCMLRLDPQKTYRIIENLLINALKYSMSGSRVYADLEITDAEVIFTMKNISATELNFEPEKLTERFVRGDESRNTEGSGLGLAIVRSFTEVQNGTFEIEIDGDLFKAVVKFCR